MSPTLDLGSVAPAWSSKVEFAGTCRRHPVRQCIGGTSASQIDYLDDHVKKRSFGKPGPKKKDINAANQAPGLFGIFSLPQKDANFRKRRRHGSAPPRPCSLCLRQLFPFFQRHENQRVSGVHQLPLHNDGPPSLASLLNQPWNEDKLPTQQGKNLIGKETFLTPRTNETPFFNAFFENMASPAMALVNQGISWLFQSMDNPASHFR